MGLVLSICTGMGLLDRALCGSAPLCNDLAELPSIVRGMHFAGVIGGPSCQWHSTMRAMRPPKFPDLTPLVLKLLDSITFDWYCFENVVRCPIPGAAHSMCNAMHYYKPHQSRPRWFTHSPQIKAPQPVYSGSVDDLLAYPVVMGRVYGPKRGAVLQGYPAASALPFPCTQLQHGLADAVPYPLALAWAQARLP